MLTTIARTLMPSPARTLQMVVGLLEEGAAGQLDALRGRAEKIKQIETEVGARIDGLETELHRLAQELSAKWRSRLHALVTSFAEISRLELLESLKQPSGAPWRCDTLWLRSDLEAGMSDS